MSTADATDDAFTIRQRMFAFAAALILVFVAILVLGFLVG